MYTCTCIILIQRVNHQETKPQTLRKMKGPGHIKKMVGQKRGSEIMSVVKDEWKGQSILLLLVSPSFHYLPWIMGLTMSATTSLANQTKVTCTLPHNAQKTKSNLNNNYMTLYKRERGGGGGDSCEVTWWGDQAIHWVRLFCGTPGHGSTNLHTFSMHMHTRTTLSFTTISKHTHSHKILHSYMYMYMYIHVSADTHTQTYTHTCLQRSKRKVNR